MGEVKYWDGEDFTVLDSKDAQSVNGIKFRINVDILEYSNDGLTWIAQSDTNTITTINGKTGVITKADIVALGIPAQDTVYTHPAGTNPHGTTKADVSLGSVDNTSDANKPVSTAQAAAIALKIDASKFQVVTELPATPTEGVFYFIKE